jgi:hypothetical protein
LAALAIAGLGACEQGKPRHPPPDPMAIAPPPPPSAAQIATAAAPMSDGLASQGGATGVFLDRVGAAIDPHNRQPASTPAGQPTLFEGFGFDAVARQPARGIDVVVDGKAYGTTYGAERPDVAAFFKTPGLVNVGFRAVLPATSLAVGAHKVVVRVVAADGKNYFDSPVTIFSVN